MMLKRPLTLVVLLTLTMLLAACADRMQATSPGTLISSGKPAVCLSLAPISPNRGKPGGVSTEDVATTLDRDRPIERLRNLVGDTDKTLQQIDHYNAVLTSLCGGSGDH